MSLSLPHTHTLLEALEFSNSSQSVFYTILDPFQVSCKMLSFAREVIAHILLRDVCLVCVCVCLYVLFSIS